MGFVGGNSAEKLQKHFVDPEKGTVHKVYVYTSGNPGLSSIKKSGIFFDSFT